MRNDKNMMQPWCLNHSVSPAPTVQVSRVCWCTISERCDPSLASQTVEVRVVCWYSGPSWIPIPLATS